MSIDDKTLENNAKAIRTGQYPQGVERHTMRWVPGTPFVGTMTVTYDVTTGDIGSVLDLNDRHSRVNVQITEDADGVRYAVKPECLIRGGSDRMSFGHYYGDRIIERTVALLNGEELPEMTEPGDHRQQIPPPISVAKDPLTIVPRKDRYSPMNIPVVVSEPTYHPGRDPHPEFCMDRAEFEARLAEYRAEKDDKQ